ncbi:MAG: replicative DNA helicase [Betaproteobacteria bacterium]
MNDTQPPLRLPPHAMEAEAAVLAGLLANNDALDLIAGQLAEGDFYSGDNRYIWRAITALIGGNKPADVIAVAEWLKDRDLLERIGGFDYLQDLERVGLPTNIRHYANLVHEKSVLRAILMASMKMNELVYATEGRSARQLLDEAQALLAAVDERSQRGVGTFRNLNEVLTELMLQLDEATKGDVNIGVQTGFHQLDRLLNPLSPGQLIVVGARPAVGKTSFAVNVGMRVAMHDQRPVGMFSMEMTDIELAVRILAQATGMAAGRFREHRLNVGDWDLINGALGKLSGAPFHVDETGGLSIQELTARARVQSKKVGGFGLLIVDYLQLARAEGRFDGNRATELGVISSGLKRLAKELQCPVMALSQLNREAAKERKLPTIAELRDSGSIEADADTVLLLHREFVMSQKADVEFDALVIIGKQRNGGIGKIDLDYDAPLTSFFDHGDSPARRRFSTGAAAYSAAKSGG